jgi:hypothetical protein
MIKRCPDSFTKEQTLKFSKMLHDNSKVAHLEPTKLKFREIRINSPLEL